MYNKTKRLLPNSLSSCKIDGCGKKAVAFHLCSTHYSKLKKYGDPTLGRTNDGNAKERKRLRAKLKPKPEQQKKAACSIEGCANFVRAKGWCQYHYDTWRRKGDPLAKTIKRLPPNSLGACKIDGCKNKAVSNHLCPKHREKFVKYGDPLGGWEQNGRSKEWHIRKGGYVIKFDRSSLHANKITGIVFQHRQVMGELIGRPLRSDENVHHKNGNRADNRPENLEMWISGQPAGQRVRDQVEWAKYILKEYAHLVDKMM